MSLGHGFQHGAGVCEMSMTLVVLMSLVNAITNIMSDVCNSMDAIVLVSDTTPQVKLLDIPIIFALYEETMAFVHALRE